MKPASLIPFLAVAATPLAAQITLFDADFDSDSNGNNQAITASSLSAATGTWSGPEGSQSGVDDIGEVIGNAVGGSSTDNALLIDTGEDNDGSTGISASNTDTLLQGNFSSPAEIAAGNPFSFSFDLYHTRLAGNTNNDQRNFRLGLSSGTTREMVIVFELHNSTETDLVVRDGDDDHDAPASSLVVDSFDRPTSNRADGDYLPNSVISVQVNVDGTGAVIVSATSPTGTTQNVTSASLTNIWNGNSTAPTFIDNFELFVGGSNTGNKGATVDNFLASGTVFTGSTAGDLTTTVIPSFPSPTLAENPNPTTNLGSTSVASGNSKGQSFSLPAAATIDSFVFEIDSVTTLGDYTLEVYQAMDGLPYILTPIFSDGGTLPAGLTAGDLIQIDLDTPLAVERGSYLVALTGTGSTSISLVLSNDDLFAAGAGARNNGSTNGWEPLTTAVSDAVFAVLGTLGTPAPTAPAGAPNIVFIMADDLGWTDLQIGGNGPNVVDGVDHGSDYYETPNIKSLADEGLSFVNCYAQPNCAPTRAAILSGQYPPRDGNGVYHVDSLNRGRNSPSFGSPPQFTGPPQNEDIPANHLISAEVLQAGGYVTAHVGKYHVGNHEGGSTTLPENQGFDFNFGGKQNGNPGNYFSTGQSFNGALGPGLQSYAKNYTSSYITENLVPHANGNNPNSLLPGSPNKFAQDGVGDAAVAFINDHSNGTMSSRPFYLQLHTYAVHTPIGNSQARPDLLSKFQAITSTDPRHDSAPYAAILENLDQTVGRVLQSLADNGLASNTIVVFTSDNGGHIGPTDNDPVRFRKGSYYGGGLRVPLIVRWPAEISGAEEGTQTDTLVHSVDFFPTFIEAAGLSMPTQNAVSDPVNYDGTSFLVHAKAPTTTTRNREPIFYHFPGYLDERARPCEVAVKQINGKEYKLIYTYDTNYVGNSNPNGSDENGSEGLDILSDNWELYNLTDDISETTDLLDGSSYSNWLLYGEIATTMAEEIIAWLDQSDSDWSPSQLTDGGSPVPFLTTANLPEVTVPFADSFRVVDSSVNFSGNEVTLDWPSETGFLYDIEVTTDLVTWTPLETDIAGTGGVISRTVSDPGIASNSERFYRVVLHD